jgi:hypothetical protein
MVSVGSESSAYEKDNGLNDTGNGRCFRKGKEKAEAFLDSRGCKTNTWGTSG